jgi:hypothetical protein
VNFRWFPDGNGGTVGLSDSLVLPEPGISFVEKQSMVSFCPAAILDNSP